MTGMVITLVVDVLHLQTNNADPTSNIFTSCLGLVNLMEKGFFYNPVDNAVRKDAHIQEPNGASGWPVRVVLAVLTIPSKMSRKKC